jgi:peroxin-3
MAARYDPGFVSLLAETGKHLSSGSFGRVLEVCLDRATDVLFRGLERDVFGPVSAGWEGTLQEPRVSLAGMLPGLAKWSHLALEGLPNELIDVRPDIFLVCSAICYSMVAHVCVLNRV